jgi:hypothetical protein
MVKLYKDEADAAGMSIPEYFFLKVKQWGKTPLQFLLKLKDKIVYRPTSSGKTKRRRRKKKKEKKKKKKKKGN